MTGFVPDTWTALPKVLLVFHFCMWLSNDIHLSQTDAAGGLKVQTSHKRFRNYMAEPFTCVSGLAKLFTGMLCLPGKALIGTVPASLKKEAMVLSSRERDVLPLILPLWTHVLRQKSRALSGEWLSSRLPSQSSRTEFWNHTYQIRSHYDSNVNHCSTGNIADWCSVQQTGDSQCELLFKYL